MQVIKRQSLIDAAISRKLQGYHWTGKRVIDFIKGHEYFDVEIEGGVIQDVSCTTTKVSEQ